MWYDSPGFLLYALLVTMFLGLCLGSFLNCVAWRYVRNQSALRGRSACPHCGHTLAPRDLIPLLSFLLAKGRCRSCQTRLSRRYPTVELLFAVVLAAILLRHGFGWDTLQFWILAGLLLTLSLIDLELQIIPNRFILGGMLCFAAFCFVSPGALLPNLWQGLRGSLLVSVPLLLLVLLFDRLLGRESMGGGDLKLFFTCGLFFDWPVNLLMLLFSCLLGLSFAAFVVKAKPGAAFPFGPAIAAACFLMMLFGPALVSWYLSLFGLSAVS